MNVLIIRNAANKVNPSNYNLQEIGLGKEFVNKGINCDIVYSNGNQENFEECIYENNNNKLNILWTKLNLKIKNNAIFFTYFKKNIFDKYDMVITTEYTQIMTFILSILIPEKLVLYHGPYRDNGRLVQKVYDFFFLPIIRKKISKIFVKSVLAKEYLNNKKFKNIKTLGVGLDIEKISRSSSNENDEKIMELRMNIMDKKVLLYIGVLEDRRNIEFLLKTFKNLLKKRNDVVLLLVGKGKQEDINKYFKWIKEYKIEDSVIYYDSFDQEQLEEIYDVANIFIMPTKYEIFGMVLLESMYFGVPVITSLNGGSSMLIENNINGYIINDFEQSKWIEKILQLLDDDNLTKKIGLNSSKTIKEKFTWEKISEEFLKNFYDN